jgi:hypothetical protein
LRIKASRASSTGRVNELNVYSAFAGMIVYHRSFDRSIYIYIFENLAGALPLN